MPDESKERRMMGETMYTVKEVAEHFKVTRQAVYDWIAKGRLRAVKVGTSTRIPESAIEAFVRPVEPGEPIEDEATE